MHKYLQSIAPMMALIVTLISGQAFAQTVPVTGQVTKIDIPAQKITIKHEPIPNLDMDRMTMVFRVNDPGMLSAVKVGQTVIFEADRVNGAITVVKIATQN